jgi:DNA-binding NtrC family response regulator
MESIRIIETQDSPVLVVQPGQARLEDVERHLILATLRRTRFNRTKSARLLGIGIRTLQRKLKQYALDHSRQTTTENLDDCLTVNEQATVPAVI